MRPNPLTRAVRACLMFAMELTGLPLDPAFDPRHFGTEHMKIPDTQICKSRMRADFYTIVDSNGQWTVTWYGVRWPASTRPTSMSITDRKTKFYNDAGTLMVLVLGAIGKKGENVDAYGVTYYSVQPGLPAKASISFWAA